MVGKSFTRQTVLLVLENPCIIEDENDDEDERLNRVSKQASQTKSSWFPRGA